MYNLNSLFNENPALVQALANTSVSNDDARQRAYEYAKMFSRNESMIRDLANSGLMQKQFSGASDAPLLSTQYFNATVASYVSSFAGYMAIERDMEQPNGLFYWYDVLGVSDRRMVMPNMGPDQFNGIRPMANIELEVAPTATQDFSALIARRLIPGSMRVTITTETEKIVLVDNGQGVFMTVPGKITEGKVDYLGGKVEFKLAKALAGDPSRESIVISGKEDTVGTPCGTVGAANANANDKRFLGALQQILVATQPDLLVAEYNIATLSAMKKATGSDMATFLFSKLRELYTKIINQKLVQTLEENYLGATMSDLDLTQAVLTGKFLDYQSRIDLFDAYLTDVETALASKAVKGVDVTAYVAGLRASNQFMKNQRKFVRNTKMTYVNDLLGWYGDVPVLRSMDVREAEGESTFYAIHKTKDGQMAPIARGIYLPLTDTPNVGNYNNPTQMASGVYYQEGVAAMAPELVQRVTFKHGI